jgi:hypothetical protein
MQQGSPSRVGEEGSGGVAGARGDVAASGEDISGLSEEGGVNSAAGPDIVDGLL